MASCTSRNWLSLCSGIGGLDLALRLADSGNRTVCYVEREAFAVAVLAKRMQEGWLDSAPVWSDLTTFDGKPWRGLVDGIAAGFPCQPVSVAGKRKAQDDARWLWDDIARVIREVEPRFLFLENVPGLLFAGNGTAIRTVLGSLAELGFDAEWCLLGADDVGAIHRRKRWFCLANTASGDRSLHAGLRKEGIGATIAPRTGELLGYTDTEGLPGWRDARSDATYQGYAWPPGPEDEAAWEAIIGRHPHLAPAVEPGLYCVVDGATVVVDADRTHQLRAIGNGVVPLQAAYAYRTLWQRMKESR